MKSLAKARSGALRTRAGFPRRSISDGQRAMPFWSLRSRAERVISTVDAYVDFLPESVPLDVWRNRWLVGLGKNGIRVDINWSGDRATGFDLTPSDVEANLSTRD